MQTRIYTKKPLKVLTVRLPRRDIELLRCAASREEISQSEFLRLALRERGTKIIREMPEAVTIGSEVVTL